MASMLLPPGWQPVDANGKPYSGGKAYIYNAGTTTDAATFQDSALTVAHAQPVVADAAGRFPNIYVSGAANLKVVLKTSSGATVFTSDNIVPYIASGTTVPVASGGTGATTAPAALTNLGASAQSDMTTVQGTVTTLSNGQSDATWQAGTATTKTALSPAQAKLAVQALESSASGVPDAILYHTQPSGTGGGTPTVGVWTALPINTEYDPSGLVTISANKFTFTKSGFVRWVVQFYRTNSSRTRLYNVSDGAEASGTQRSLNCYASDASSSTHGPNFSFGSAYVIAAKQYELDYLVLAATGGAAGLGQPLALGTEVYALIEFFKNHQA